MCDPATRPAFIPAPNTARVRMVYESNGSTVMNVFHFLGDAPLIAADLSGLVDEVHTEWVAFIKARQVDTLTLRYIEATALDDAAAPQVTLVVNETGSGTGELVPNNVTLAIKFATGLTGRSNRGRMFFLGMGKAGISGDQVTDATVSANVSAVTSFFDGITTALGLRHAIVSYCNNKAWRTTASVEPVLSYLVTDNNIDSQRRRLAGRGM